MFARLRSLARALTARGAFEIGLKQEFRFHIEQYAEDLGSRAGRVDPMVALAKARCVNGVRQASLTWMKGGLHHYRGLPAAFAVTAAGASPCTPSGW